MGKIKWLILLAIWAKIAFSADFPRQLRNLNINLTDKSYHFDYIKLFSENTFISYDGISPECVTDIQRISNAINNTLEKISDDFFNKVVISLIDSSGRPLPGVLKGNNIFMGLVKECEDISYAYTDTSRSFRGQYIRVFINQALLDYKVGCEHTRSYYWDLCLPYDCTHEDLLKVFRRLINLPTGSPVCSVVRLRDNPEPLDYRSYIVLGVMGTIFFVCLMASLYDAFILPNISPDQPVSFAMTCFRCFSSYTIIGEILSTKAGKKPGQIPQLNFIRFASMCWVIYGHTLTGLIYFAWNIADLLDIIGSLGAVDSFFFQSGLLLSFLWFRAYSKNPKQVNSTSSWILFYVHRIVRLSPAYYMAVLFYGYVYVSFVTQFPLFFGVPNLTGHCKSNFWHNLLFINNIFGTDDPCYPVSWYLATDMQIYIFAPLLLLPFTFNATLGLAFSFLVLILSTLANFITVLVYHFPPSSFNLGAQDPDMTVSFTVYSRLVYYAAWVRCQVYVLGFLVGYLLHRKPKIKINRLVNLAGWFLCICLAVGIILPTRRWTMGHPMELGLRAIYSSLNRLSFGLILAWIVVTCQYGYGGPINAFLSWGGWLPLGRLSYSVYLIHMIVVTQYARFTDNGIVFTSLFQIFCIFSVPVMLFSYLLSIIWSSTFEVPFAKLEALVITRLMGHSRRVEPIPKTETEMETEKERL